MNTYAQSGLSFRSRLILTYAVPWLCVVLFGLMYLPARQKALILEDAKRQLTLLSEMLCFSVGEGLSEGQLDLVQSAYDWSKKTANITYVAIYDEEGKIIVEHNPEKRPHNAISQRGPSSEDGETFLSRVTPVYDPAKQQQLGTIVLVYSLDQAHIQITQQKVVSISVGVVVFAIGLWGIFLLARQESTLRTANKDLEEARRLVLQSSNLKSEFVATMSHEIRTPMNGVIGMTELLLDTKLTGEQQEYAETIRNSADMLLAIINDILDFSKIEAGKARLEFAGFDLVKVVEETVELLVHRAREKNLELASLVESNVPAMVYGDAGRLRQVLMNLVSNAVKFTERGEVAVRASRLSETATHVTLRFAIADTGIGISEETLHRLFQPFTQADGSTTRKHGGTGLGLAISKRLVELMGGTIGVESKPGNGSIFWFTIGFKKQTRVHDVNPNGHLKGARVLVVDDNATSRNVLHHLLTSWGMKDQGAADPIEALALLHQAVTENDPYALAILDMEMPAMDGQQLARIIKSDVQISMTPLVMLMQKGQNPRPGMMNNGLAGFIAKPIRQSALYDVMINVLHREGSLESTFNALKPLKRSEKIEDTSKPLSGLKILVVEDNLINQRVAAVMLEQLGCSPDLANDGLEAVGTLSKTDYDIVLMDCQMPEMDGYKATMHIREREGTVKHTRIIAMTANAMVGDRDRCIAAGMDDYIAKPINQADLLSIIQRNISQASVGQS